MDVRKLQSETASTTLQKSFEKSTKRNSYTTPKFFFWHCTLTKTNKRKLSKWIPDLGKNSITKSTCDNLNHLEKRTHKIHRCTENIVVKNMGNKEDDLFTISLQFNPQKMTPDSDCVAYRKETNCPRRQPQWRQEEVISRNSTAKNV